MFKRLAEFFHAKPRQHPMVVSFDDQAVTITDERNGKAHTAKWQALEKIWVRTTDEGPWREGAYIIFEQTDSPKLIIPSEARNVGELIKKLTAMSGFDEKMFVHAMGCTNNQIFVCWNKP